MFWFELTGHKVGDGGPVFATLRRGKRRGAGKASISGFRFETFDWFYFAHHKQAQDKAGRGFEI
jgi:hypothetical protein